MINVLIVEDDPMVAELNRYYLEQVGGFQFQGIAISVDDAFKILEQKHIDLILLDIFMSGSNGLEFLSKLRKIGEGVDVIVVSASTDSQSIKKALQYGAVDYLIKPFEFERFHDALTAYKERVTLMRNQDQLSQKDLDKQIFHKDATNKTGELPKGINRDTLKLAWDQIQGTQGESFTTEEMAQQVGISRVSIRKYIGFLGELGVLKTEVIYGSVGRPVYRHRFISSKSKALNRYLESMK